jgi:hypothetical protein
MAAAGIMLLAALITAVTIRIRKADLAGVNPIKVGLAAPVAGEPAGDARPTAPRGSGRPLSYRAALPLLSISCSNQLYGARWHRRL